MGDLAELLGSWDNVSDDDIGGGGSFKSPSEGQQLAVVKNITISDAPSGSGQVIDIELFFPKDNLTWNDRFYPDGSEPKVKIMKGRLKALGLKATSVQSLKSALKSTIGWTVNTSVKKNGKYTNVYFNGVHSKAATEAVDNIPF